MQQFAYFITVAFLMVVANGQPAQEIEPVIPPFEHALTAQKASPEHTSFVFTCPDITDADVTATCILQQVEDRKVLGRFPLRKQILKDRETTSLRFSVGCLFNEMIASGRIEVYVRYNDRSQRDGWYKMPLKAVERPD